MEYTHLGRLGLVVSRLTLGTMNFGPHSSEGDSHAIMDAAIAHGVNFFDTANVYGRHLGVGATEEIIGRWIAKGGGRREKVVLASKVYGQMGDWPNEGRLSVLAIRKACEASLKRLRTDHIDLYQMHHIDRDAWWNEVWQAMELLVQQGKILYVGSSNFAGWHIARANEIARARNFLGPGVGAEPVQPQRADRRAGGAARGPRVRHGVHPVQPAVRRPAGRRAVQGRGGTSLQRVPAGRDPGAPGSARAMGAALRRARRTALRRRARVAASRSRASRRRSSGRARPISSTRRCARSRSTWTTTCSSGSTRSSRVRAAPRPRPTPGSRAPARSRVAAAMTAGAYRLASARPSRDIGPETDTAASAPSGPTIGALTDATPACRSPALSVHPRRGR